MRWSLSLTALAALLLLPTSVAGSPRPPFAHSYRGTITGAERDEPGLNVVRYRWTIRGLRLRLVHPFHDKYGWHAGYRVTAGMVSLHARETGYCAYTAATRFHLAKSFVDQRTSPPLQLLVKPSGRSRMHSYFWTARDDLRVRKTCQETGVSVENETPPTLFDPGRKQWPIGPTAAGTHKVDREGTKARWRWSLTATS